MNTNLPIDNKLTVLMLVEPGCLGPKGTQLIQKFCGHAQTLFLTFGSDNIRWQFSPRLDKRLPEISYQVNQKKLSPSQAAKYLDVFSINIDTFEEQLNERIAFIIEQYHPM